MMSRQLRADWLTRGLQLSCDFRAGLDLMGRFGAVWAKFCGIELTDGFTAIFPRTALASFTNIFPESAKILLLSRKGDLVVPLSYGGRKTTFINEN